MARTIRGWLLGVSLVLILSSGGRAAVGGGTGRLSDVQRKAIAHGQELFNSGDREAGVRTLDSLQAAARRQGDEALLEWAAAAEAALFTWSGRSRAADSLLAPILPRVEARGDTTLLLSATTWYAKALLDQGRFAAAESVYLRLRGWAPLSATIKRQFGRTTRGEGRQDPGRRLFPGWPWAAAAGLAVAVVLLVTQKFDQNRSEPAPYRGADATTWGVEAPAAAPDGGIRLRWHSHLGADSYRLTIYDPSLQPVFASRDAPETTLVLTAADLVRWHRTGSTFVWRVTALKGGDVVEDSDVLPLTIP